MTAEQEASWKAQRREYLLSYNKGDVARAKSKVRNDRYRARPGIRKRDMQNNLAAVMSDPDRLADKRRRNAEWMKLYWQRRRLNEEFDAFIARVEAGE